MAKIVRREFLDPADLVDQHAPLLAKHLERVENYPEVAAYYAARRK